MPRLTLGGPEGVLVLLAVAVFVGLAIGTGALDFPAVVGRLIPRPSPSSTASAVAGATHG